MKYKYIRLKTMLLACSLALSSLGLEGCSHQKSSSENQVVLEREVNRFAALEHIISVPISEDIRLENHQYEYHEGYDVVGISITAYGMRENSFGGGSLIYINTEEVDCSTNVKDENNHYVYLDFGIPIRKEEESISNNEFGVGEHIITSSLSEYKELEDEEQVSSEYERSEQVLTAPLNEGIVFGVGEHIISTPISEDNRLNAVQYEYHEGYEVVGFATTAYGRFDNNFGGGVVLYKNVVPVICTLCENGYTSFGTPWEVEKVNSLNK